LFESSSTLNTNFDRALCPFADKNGVLSENLGNISKIYFQKYLPQSIFFSKFDLLRRVQKVPKHFKKLQKKKFKNNFKKSSKKVKKTTKKSSKISSRKVQKKVKRKSSNETVQQ